MFHDFIYEMFCETWVQLWSSHSPVAIVTWPEVSKTQSTHMLNSWTLAWISRLIKAYFTKTRVRKVFLSFNNHKNKLCQPPHLVIYWSVVVGAVWRDWPFSPELPAVDAEDDELPLADAESHDLSWQSSSSDHLQSYTPVRHTIKYWNLKINVKNVQLTLRLFYPSIKIRIKFDKRHSLHRVRCVLPGWCCWRHVQLLLI